MEPTNPPMIGKKLWHIVRIVFLMLQKKISKSKLLVDLHRMMSKRGKILEKVIGNLMFQHNHTSFSCKSNDAQMSYIGPKEYEFSCSNSPAFPFHLNKRNKKHHHHHHHSSHRNTHFFSPAQTTNNKAATVTAVQKILEMLNNEITAEASPVAILPAGFGRSPMVRQLRITDSPFPVRDVDENSSQVDKEAEEFIERFYEQLRLQKMVSVRESRNQNGVARSFG